MPEPERHLPASAPRPVQAGLGVEDIRHIPVRKRELRFTRNRSGAILTATGFLLAATAAFLQLTGYDTITPYLPAPLWAMQAAALVPAALCLAAGSPLPETRGRHRHPGGSGNPALPENAAHHAMVLLAAD